MSYTNNFDVERAIRHKDEFYPMKVFDEETGKNQDFLLSFNCRYPEPTVLNLAEWSHEQNRLVFKVTGMDPDGNTSFDYWVVKCQVGNANNAEFKKYIKGRLKDLEKLHRFPDEYYSNQVTQMRRTHPEVLVAIRDLTKTVNGCDTLARWREQELQSLPKISE